jgi:hypothetical protein
VEIGFHLVNFDVPGGVQALPATLAAAAKAAEQAGASWFTMADHFSQMDNLWPAEAPMLEIYTCLGYLAGRRSGSSWWCWSTASPTTTRVCWPRRRPLWTCYRADGWCSASEQPGMSVNASAWGCPFRRCRNATSGWKRPCKSAARCGARTTGATTESTTSSPRRCAPRNRFSGPTRQSYSGTGERKTLRLVAQYADSWNGGFQTVEEAAHKIDVLYRHCDAIDRHPGEIHKTAIMLIDPMGDLDGFLRTAEQYAALGIDLIDVMPPEDTTDPVAFASCLGEQVIPRVAQIECGPKPRGSADHLHAE